MKGERTGTYMEKISGGVERKRLIDNYTDDDLCLTMLTLEIIKKAANGESNR